MKMRILGAIAAAALLAGCTAARQDVGASAENDQNVLTGGPMIGTTIADLPQPVKNTLKDNMPHAEIGDIEKSTVNGQLVYKITFLKPGTNPTVYIREDGKILTGSDLMHEEK